MKEKYWPRNAAVLFEGKHGGPGGLSFAFAAGLREHGCEVVLVGRDQAPDPEVDFVLGYGPSTWEGSLIPVADRLRLLERDRRPFFYWWYIESIPSPGLPEPAARLALQTRMLVDRLTIRTPAVRDRLESLGIAAWFRRGFRFQVLSELDYYRRHGLLDGLAITSESRAAYLRRHGFDPRVVPIGYHADLHGSDLGLERTIDVGFLGNTGSRRRANIMNRLIADLEGRGYRTSIQTNLYGEARTTFLNRSKILLNIFRSPQDFYGLRFLFAAGNKALLVTEPAADTEPFQPGEHLVMASVQELTEAINFYLREGDLRRSITESAYRLVTGEYTIGKMIGRILAHAREIRAEGTGFVK